MNAAREFRNLAERRKRGGGGGSSRDKMARVSVEGIFPFITH